MKYLKLYSWFAFCLFLAGCGPELGVDAEENVLLQDVELTHRGKNYSQITFLKRGDYTIIGLPRNRSISGYSQIWLLATSKSSEKYAQMPQDKFRLSSDDVNYIINQANVSPEVKLRLLESVK
jgi:NACalpha-BTF3-like transcription factor